MYFTPPPPEKHYVSRIYHLVLLFIADSRKYHQILTLLNNNRWLNDNSTKFRQLLKQSSILSPILFAWTISQNSCHYKALRLLCSINAISSPSRVFKLQNPIVLHCLISPLKNWDVWGFFIGVNNPTEIHSCNSFYELQKKLKVMCNPCVNATQGGTNMFAKHLFATSDYVIV